MYPHVLHCPDCGHSEYLRPTELLRRMQQAGMLRRTADPDPDLVKELLRGALARWRCSHCDHQGLTAEEVEEEDEWDDARSCEVCGVAILAERLEVFPKTRRCAACEQAAAAGTDVEAEYCPRCGTPMQLRTSRGGGIARYAWSCPQCRR